MQSGLGGGGVGRGGSSGSAKQAGESASKHGRRPMKKQATTADSDLYGVLCTHWR